MKLRSIIVTAGAACLLSSCSLFSPKGTTVSGADATATGQTTKKNDRLPENHQDVKNTGTKSNVRKNSGTAIESTAERLAGEWMIVSVGGKTLKTVDDMPYINFEKQTGRFYASNGCNIINGSYTIRKDNTIVFGKAISTMKMCYDVQFESEITSILSKEVPLTFKIDKIGHESYLRLFNPKGSELLSARKHNMDFLNGNWLITSVNGKTVNDEEANVFIDINELKLHGNTGCNFFNGTIYINPDKSNAIDFSKMALTRMACPKMEQEAAILLALEETTTAIQGNSDQVILLNQDGKELMTLKKAEPRPEEE